MTPLRLTLALNLIVCFVSPPVAAKPARAAKGRSAKAAKAAKASREASRARAPRRARPRSGARGCRGIFCNGVRVVAMDGKPGKQKGLTYKQVEQEMGRLRGKLLPCALQERRRNPRLREARIELAVVRGRVLATRVNGQRRTTLARCIHTTLRRQARFVRLRFKQVAEFRLTLAQ